MFLITCLAFLPAGWNEFVSLDDHKNFQKNFAYRGLGPDNIRWAWTTFHNGAYQPLSWMMFSVQYVLFGMDPTGYHVVSVLLQGLCGALFYLVARRLLALAMPDAAAAYPHGLRMAAVLAALLFAIHPLRTEAVAWLSTQPYLWVGIFYLLAILAYLRACASERQRRPRGLWLALACLAYAASILSKGVGVALVAVLVILDVYPLGRLWPNRRAGHGAPSNVAVLAEKVPFLLLGIASALLAVKSKQEAMVPVGEYDMVHRVFQAAWGAIFYLRKTLLPVDLSPWYQFEPGFGIAEPRFVVSLLLVIAVTVAAVLTWRRWRAGLALWAYYLIVLLPLSHLVKIGRQAAADRYTYIACMGWAVLGGAGLLEAWRARGQRRIGRRTFQAIGAVCVLVCIGLGVLSWRQAQVWRDGLSLWSQAVGVSPYLAIPRNNLSQELVGRGRYDEALIQIEKAVELDPNDATARVNLGIAKLRLGQTQQGLEELQTALRLRPGYASAHGSLGAAYLSMGRYEKAIEHLRQAVGQRATDVTARTNLANALIRLSRFDEAIDHCQATLRRNPESATACALWGTALLRQGRGQEAEDRFRRALELEPQHGLARLNLVRIVERRGDRGEALELLREGASLPDASPDVIAALISTLLTSPDASLRDPKAALNWAERAEEASESGHLGLLEARARALLAGGHALEAIAVLERAVASARRQHRQHEGQRLARLLQACRARAGLPH